MAYSSVPPVVALSIDAVELAHPFGKVCLGSFDDQVIMIVHQTGGVAQPVKALHDFSQALQERMAIRVVIVDVFAGIAPRRYMVDRPVKLQAKRTSHDLCRYHTDVNHGNIQDLTP